MAENPGAGITAIRILLTFTGIAMIAAGLIILFLNNEGTEMMFIVSLALVIVGIGDLIFSWFVFRKT